MEPLNRPYRNRQEANGESMIPVDRQPTDPRTRIAAVLLGDHCVQGMTKPCDDCRAHALRQADAVIRELDDAFVDFGAWLAEEITGRTMTRIDLESCLEDWKGYANE